MGNYHLSNKAVEDLKDIWLYTLCQWSERQADSYYELLITSCMMLTRNPILPGKVYDGIYTGLRGYKAGHHIIFYIILDNSDIEIVRILHERMDIPNRL